MRSARWLGAAALLGVALAAQAAAPEFGGQVRPIVTGQQAANKGPLAQAVAIDPTSAALPASGVALETELRSSGHGLTGVGTLRIERAEGQATQTRGWVNELYAAGGDAGWQFSAGKRIVAWDVGYAFRPNDVVQREARRLLIDTTPEGRPLAMAEYFDASDAASLVWVNPTQPRSRRGGEEPALALRGYRRLGALDAHAFARVGGHTGPSVGAAGAWVASDELELHASLRWLHDADTLALAPGTDGLARTDPWVAAATGPAAQALVGGTWTNAAQVGLLAEAWWDGTAPSDAQWDAWQARNRQLAGLVGGPAPAAAVAGNLAWQARAFGAAGSLRRANLFGRASWTLDRWTPALDVLFTPADRGRVLTASLGWQGDRVRADVGLRFYGGPDSALTAQLPTRRVGYVAVTWSF